MDVGLNFRKLTGPIEHWLTTLHRGYWGFRPDKRKAWGEIREDEVFVFHASRSEFLNAPRGALTDLDTGIIGLGRVGAKSTKSEPAWWEELHQGGEYPYLIHFSEIYWFGDIDEIRDVAVTEKNVDEMVEDVHALSENIITFSEMRDRVGYQIPAQGSPGNIKSPEKLFPLLQERIEGSFNMAAGEAEETSTSSRSVRDRNRERNLEPEAVETQSVTYEPSVRETITATINHEETLDTFEDYLADRGFSGGETMYSDLIMQSGDHVVLGEAKSIHERNEPNQIRHAIGQLLEYRFRDIYGNEERERRKLTLCLVLNQEPTDDYKDILESIEDDGIFTYWVTDGDVEGLSRSMTRLSTLAG